jgi:hypothetical protein
MISIADRRTIMTNSMTQPDFRDLLRRDPRAAVEQVAGSGSSGEARISIVEEQPEAWEFVVPASAIDAELPEPEDPRSVVENDVYEMLRNDPAVRARVIGDPKAFLAEKFQLDLGPTGVNVREEQPGELLIVLPYRDGREELNDEALDLVVGGDGATGGGQIGCQTNGPNNKGRPPEGS